MLESFDLSLASLLKGSLIALALMVAIIGHEIMHGYIAYKYGDSTAKDNGRLSINPIKHIDPLGTIIIPLLLFIANAPFLFGWAKPVPVNIHTVVNNGGYNGAIAVSLAGVAYNFSLAVFASFLVGFVDGEGLFWGMLTYFLIQLTVYNVLLGVFNLLPLPPLDGSQALAYLGLKFGNSQIARFFNKIERYGMIILIVILVTPLKMIIFAPVSFILGFLF